MRDSFTDVDCHSILGSVSCQLHQAVCLSAPHAVLGDAVVDLDSVVAIDALLGRDARRLNERLGDQAGWQQRFTLAAEWLGDRLAAASPVATEINWAWRQISSRRGAVRIEQLADELGWSRRQFWSRFRSQIGLTPKQAAKLIRFDHAVHRLAAGAAPAQVAADVGFSDQSHLHRDVAAFTGLTPVTVADEPFLAVDDVAWGWPGRRPTEDRDRAKLRTPE